jgi:hypothetical protein
MVSVALFGGGDRLVIEALDYERPGASDSYDSNWISTTVSIKSGAFSGSFSASFFAHDFARLQAGLEQVLKDISGTVAFESAEGDLAFTIELFARGSAVISGVAKPNSSRESSLRFEFESDQTILSEAVKQLNQVLRRLPLRGRL